MNIETARLALEKIMDKARVHFYKPIQIAEILHRDRVFGDLNLTELETYRMPSKKWRDEICQQFIGRTSNSSARYQDDLFNENAVPPAVLAALGVENRRLSGGVEAFIYSKFRERFSQVSVGLDYCRSHDRLSFQLAEFMGPFKRDAGLKRSIDKVYEIVVFALFSAILESLELSVEVSFNPSQSDILREFDDFAERIVRLNPDQTSFKTAARLFRVGVTNAADRGLDMWGNFGLAIQIKHLSLSEELAEGIVGSVSADRIVIVCKDAEERVIVSLLNQLGWKSKIQAIITETDLINWYEKALRGRFAGQIGEPLLKKLATEIRQEFPVTQPLAFADFFEKRGYDRLKTDF